MNLLFDLGFSAMCHEELETLVLTQILATLWDSVPSRFFWGGPVLLGSCLDSCSSCSDEGSFLFIFSMKAC